MPSHVSPSLASLSPVLFCHWNVPTFVYLFNCVCPSIIFPARLPAEWRTVWINETELTGLLMKACLHSLHFLWLLCTWEPLGVDFYIWVFVVLLIKAGGNGLVFVNQVFLILNSSSFHASSARLPLPSSFLRPARKPLELGGSAGSQLNSRWNSFQWAILRKQNLFSISVPLPCPHSQTHLSRCEVPKKRSGVSHSQLEWILGCVIPTGAFASQFTMGRERFNLFFKKFRRPAPCSVGSPSCLFDIAAWLWPSWFSASPKSGAVSWLCHFPAACGWLGPLLLFEKVLHFSTFSLCRLLSFWKPPLGTIFLLSNTEGTFTWLS